MSHLVQQPAGHTTRTLLRGLKLVELVAEASEGIGVTDLARAADLDKGTTSRLLATLREAGWVRQDPVDRRYRLTGKFARFSRVHADTLNLQALARPHLTKLRDEVNETVHLGVIEGNSVVYIDKLECSNSIRLVSTVGQHMPILTTALGRAILSTLAPSELGPRFRELTLAKRTSHTISDKAVLLEEIAGSATRGYAIDHEQNEDGVSCVGAPLFDPEGAARAAISVSGPSFRIVPKFAEVGEAVRLAAGSISRELGYPTGDRPPHADAKSRRKVRKSTGSPT